MVIERALRFRVCGEQNLEAAVEQESLKFVGSNAATDSVWSFDHLKGNSSVG
jgi:hypothetical protein